MRKIVLIGYRACGKSTVAQQLAERLRWKAFDSDSEIERRCGKSIATLFAEDKEPFFRDTEARVIAEILHRPEPLVLATGGGAPMRTETQEQFKHSNAYVVWLTASPAVILERLNADLKTAATRPPLTSLPVADEILSLLEKRLPVYRGLCDLEISTDVISPEEIVRQIKREIDTAGG